MTVTAKAPIRGSHLRLNGWAYRVDHHDADLRKLLGDDDRHADTMAASFAYANRTVLGLGITTDGDDLGTASPESDVSPNGVTDDEL